VLEEILLRIPEFPWRRTAWRKPRRGGALLAEVMPASRCSGVKLIPNKNNAFMPLKALRWGKQRVGKAEKKSKKVNWAR
jgi:hypothetical protein